MSISYPGTGRWRLSWVGDNELHIHNAASRMWQREATWHVLKGLKPLLTLSADDVAAMSKACEERWVEMHKETAAKPLPKVPKLKSPASMSDLDWCRGQLMIREHHFGCRARMKLFRAGKKRRAATLARLLK